MLKISQGALHAAAQLPFSLRETSRCKIELIFGIMLQFNVVWCIRSAEK